MELKEIIDARAVVGVIGFLLGLELEQWHMIASILVLIATLIYVSWGIALRVREWKRDQKPK